MGAALGRPQPAAEPPKRRPRLDIHTLPQEILLHAFSFLTTVQRSPGRPASPTSVAVKTLLRSRFVLGLVSADFEAAMRTHKSAHPRAWFPALYGAVPGEANVGELRSRAAAARHRNLVDVLARRHATERRRPAGAARAASRPVDLGTLKELSVIAFDRMLDHLAGRSWQLLVHDVRLVHRGGDHAPETAAVREASDAAKALFAGQAAPWRASWPPLARGEAPDACPGAALLRRWRGAPSLPLWDNGGPGFKKVAGASGPARGRLEVRFPGLARSAAATSSPDADVGAYRFVDAAPSLFAAKGAPGDADEALPAPDAKLKLAMTRGPGPRDTHAVLFVPAGGAVDVMCLGALLGLD